MGSPQTTEKEEEVPPSAARWAALCLLKVSRLAWREVRSASQPLPGFPFLLPSPRSAGLPEALAASQDAWLARAGRPPCEHRAQLPIP